MFNRLPKYEVVEVADGAVVCKWLEDVPSIVKEKLVNRFQGRCKDAWTAADEVEDVLNDMINVGCLSNSPEGWYWRSI